MKKIVLSLSICFFSTSALAVTNCGSYKVRSIQTQANDVLVEFLSSDGKSYFKQIGLWSSPSTRPFLATAMQAFAMNKPVSIRYAQDNYLCASTEYTIPIIMIRIANS